MRDVLVIGGGVAGLVAARACAHVGLSVTVLEATDAVGGAVAAHEVAGLTLDSGAESFAVRGNAVAEFVAGLGLADEVVAPNPAGAWLHLPANGSGAVSVPLPKAGVLGIPASPLADDVRRVIGWGGAWRAYLDRLMPVLTIGREHSLGDLVRKRMGRRGAERGDGPGQRAGGGEGAV
ncbi:MAG TPA: FAD-dependent oxidoreductase, partial [Cryobacterium sp.]|nr:FAD-dependent oxidoreductase [Cryobacterium sp.]